MKKRLPAVLLVLLLMSGCSTDDTPATGADPDTDTRPVTEGDWYRPGLSVTWQWQLTGTIDRDIDADVYDIDLFEATDDDLQALHQQGRKLIAYFSAGSAENWRPDFGEFPSASLGKPLDGWAGERWLDYRQSEVWAIMQNRLELAVSRGFDGVEFDNVTGAFEDTGFDLAAADQLAFNRHLANEAHRLGLTAVLKNDGEQVPDLVAYFDLALNEECHQFNECAPYGAFISAGKPVFNVEYASDMAAAQTLADMICATSTALAFRTLVMPLALDGTFRVACP